MDRSDRDLLYSAQVCLHQALRPSALGLAGQAEARGRYERASWRFLRDHPEDSAAPAVRFNRDRLFYDRGDLTWDREEFWLFIDRHPAHRDVPIAGHLILRSLFAQDDFGALLQAAWRLLGEDRIEDAAFKKELRLILGVAKDRGVY